MTERNKPVDDLELFDKVEQGLADDLLGESYSRDEIVAMLQAEGVNPEAIGERGLENVVSALTAHSSEPASERRSYSPRRRPARRALLDVVYARKGRRKTRKDEKKPENLSDAELLALAQSLLGDGHGKGK